MHCPGKELWHWCLSSPGRWQLGPTSGCKHHHQAGAHLRLCSDRHGRALTGLTRSLPAPSCAGLRLSSAAACLAGAGLHRGVPLDSHLWAAALARPVPTALPGADDVDWPFGALCPSTRSLSPRSRSRLLSVAMARWDRPCRLRSLVPAAAAVPQPRGRASPCTQWFHLMMVSHQQCKAVLRQAGE